MLLLMCTAAYILTLTEGRSHLYSLKYFQQKKVQVATGIFCTEKDAFNFLKLFSAHGFSANIILPDHQEFLEPWTKSVQTRVGVVLDGNCEYTAFIIDYASKNRLMDMNRHWLIYVDEHFTLKELEKASERWEPEMFDVIAYIKDGVDKLEHSERISQINFEANADILRMLSSQSLGGKMPQDEENEKLKFIATMGAIADSEVTLAILDQEHLKYDLYDAHRMTFFTRMKFELIGKMEDSQLTIFKANPGHSATTFRTDYNGTLMRTACSLLVLDYYSRSGELTSKEFDRYALMGLDMFFIIEDMLNFKGILKCTDNYGWKVNGTYTGMLELFKSQKTDMLSQGMLLTNARLPVVDYVNTAMEAIMGVTYRVPTLPQVSNIFMLPYAKDVWMSLGGFFILSTTILYFLLKISESVGTIRFYDAVFFFTGVACQQGTEIYSKTVSVRVAMMSILITSLFMFTSYTANIVSLLQSPSNSIGSIKDITNSPFHVGVQNLLFVRKMVEDDKSPDMMELYNKKILPHGERSFLPVRDGLKLIIKGMYAYQSDAAALHKEIGLTCTEYEKCGLKFLRDQRGSFNGPAVPKKSPFREILKQKHMLLKEHGFMDRNLRRWTPHEPVCYNAAANYEPVGLIEVSPLFILLLYGTSCALILLTGEWFCKKSIQLNKKDSEGSEAQPFEKLSLMDYCSKFFHRSY